MLRFTFLSLLFLGMLGCKSPKEVQTNVPKVEDWKVLTQKAQASEIDFQTLSINGNMNVPLDEGEMGFSYKLNMIKDSLIWMKVSKFGLEGMRVLATPSKVQILDRTSQTCRVLKMSELKSVLGIEVDFAALQKLLLGSMPLMLENPAFEEQKGGAGALKGKFAGSDVRYEFTPDFRLGRLQADRDTLHANIDFQQYAAIAEGKNLVPHLIKAVVGASQKKTFTLFPESYKLNPSELQTGFTVPEGYQVIEK